MRHSPHRVSVACVCLFLFSCHARTGDTPRNASELAIERFHAGVNLLYQHKHSEAELAFREVTKDYPRDLAPWMNLAIAQLNQILKPDDPNVAEALATLAQVEQFAPHDPRMHFCRGIVLDFIDDLEGALREFLSAIEILPADAYSHYWAGKELADLQRDDEALPHFEAAVVANPLMQSGWYRLVQLYRVLGREEDAERAQAEETLLRRTRRGAMLEVKYTMMGRLADGITEWVPVGESANDDAKPIRFGTPALVEGAAAPFAFVDPDRDGIVFLWCGGKGAGIYEVGAKGGVQVAPLEVLGTAFSFATADLNDDARIDLVTSEPEGVTIWFDDAPAKMPNFTKASHLPAAARGIVRLADLDLERDLDLVFSSETGGPELAINLGLENGFAPFAESARFLRGLPANARLLLIRDLDGDLDQELIFAAESGLTLVDNGPDWRFRVAPPERVLAISGAVTDLAAADLDGDGFDDLVVAGSGRGIWWNDGAGSFPGPPSCADLFAAAKLLHIVDLDLDGYSDILAGSEQETRVVRNRGRRVFATQVATLPAAVGFTFADIDRDFDLDLVFEAPDGRVFVVTNDTAPPHNTLRLTLRGERDDADGERRTNSHGLGVRVAIRCGDLRHDETYVGTPGVRGQGLAPITIGLGPRKKSELLVARWTDGVIQSEFGLETNCHHRLIEAQRKPISCPVLFTWDGKHFRFITDFLGGGGLGIWAGPDRYEPFDPSETVRIPPGALAALSGEFQLSVMEPMEEVSYLDRIRLCAVDHPQTVEVYPDEMFSTSSALVPTGAPIAIETKAKILPTRATDGKGDDVLENLLQIDQKYAGDFALDRRRIGYAEPHSLCFGFDGGLPREERVLLFLHGWVEFANSRTNFSAYQAGKHLEAPTFLYRTAPDAQWQVLYEHAGFPAGISKMMVLDVTRAARAGATDFRIDTNMEIYWDQAFVASPVAPPGLVIRDVSRTRALLRFGGYPRWYSNDGRKPNTFHYQERMPAADFKRFRGAHTPYGEVGELLDAQDDRFVLIASGDELLMHFGAKSLPELPLESARTFLLDAFGYVKDMDPLSASPTHLEPFPFSEMATYPPR